MHKCVLIVLLCLMSLTIAHAQDTISPELQAQLDAIELTTTEIRGLDRLEATTLGFPSTDDLEEFIVTEFNEEYSDEEFADDLLFYVAFDLMEPDIDLEEILIDFLLSQVAGYYDPETDTMNVVLLSGEDDENSIPVLEQITYSHEYVHALQDQHFDLETLFDMIDATDNGDFQLAVLSLVEGDATQAMTDYTLILAEENPTGLFEAMMAAGADLGGLSLPEGVPPVVGDELLFPYLQGQIFIAHLINAVGWSAVDSAFTDNLPQSTEHIYHPERYLAGDMPIAVTIPDMSDLLGDNWRVAQDTTVGEFYLRQYLGTHLGSHQVADMTTGWGGDRMNLWVDDATGELTWVIYQVWDTPDDATEFADGFVEFLTARFADGDSDGTCWTDADTICFAQIDDTTTRISASLDPELALALLNR